MVSAARAEHSGDAETPPERAQAPPHVVGSELRSAAGERGTEGFVHETGTQVDMQSGKKII